MKVTDGHNTVGKVFPHGHALLLVNHQRVLLDFDVLVEAVAVLEEVVQGGVALGQLVLQQPDHVEQVAHLHGQVGVRFVVAQLDVGPPQPLLEPRLGELEGRVLAGDGRPQPVHRLLGLVDLLK